MVDLDLHDKVVLVTGGASGIGQAIVQLLSAEGALVAVADKNPDALADLRRSLCQPDRIEFICADLVDEAACQKAVERSVGRFGSLWGLVNNAGVNDGITLEAAPSQFVESLGRNLVQIFSVTHFALAPLRKSHGAIVNISSKVSLTGQGSTSGYAAAKGGVNALTREWALALAKDGVRVNAVVPAECDTPQYRRWFAAQADPAAARRQIEQMVPLGQRLSTPEEIAAAVVFLLSPRSSHTTGQFLFVDGGYTHLDRACTQSRHEWKG